MFPTGGIAGAGYAECLGHVKSGILYTYLCHQKFDNGEFTPLMFP